MSPVDDEFPALIRELYRVVGDLEAMWDRPFTPDGHLVGSLGECFAKYHYGVELCPCSNEGFDGLVGAIEVEIKTTQTKSVSLRSEAQHLLVLELAKDGSFTEIYNGPGWRAWDLVSGKPRPSNGQYRVSLSRLRGLMAGVEPTSRLASVRPLPGAPHGAKHVETAQLEVE